MFLFWQSLQVVCNVVCTTRFLVTGEKKIDVKLLMMFALLGSTFVKRHDFWNACAQRPDWKRGSTI